MLVVAGAAAYLIVNAPPPDLVPVAKTFLTELDEGRHLQALDSGLLRDRWDLQGLIETTHTRQRRLGRLVGLERTGPDEEVELPRGLAHGRGRRMRLTGTFERGEQEMIFTFARRGSRWVVRDLEFLSNEPPDLPGLETHVRLLATQVAEMMGQGRWLNVHEKMVRAERLANPPETWTQTMEPKLDGMGGFQRVEERAWTYAEGRATFTGRLHFEGAQRDVQLDLRYDPSEGRVVVTRLAFLP